jgi:hypothetical protein
MMSMDAGTLLVLVSLASPAAHAALSSPQTPAPAGSSAAAPAVTAAPEPARWELGVEYRRDRFDYRFENPSSFNTEELVPHVFEQRYDTDNVWFTGRIQYTLGSRILETEGGVTATTTGVGSDYDMFYQPDGNVIVYGTTADTDAWSWRAAQYVGLGTWRGVVFRAGYSYHRDRADFRPSYSTTVQTKPPSSTTFWNTDRETTVSEVHEIRVGVERTFTPGPSWRARLTADVAPTTLARLTTTLPDKYPDPIVFIAKGLSVNATLHITRQIGRWHAGMAVSYAQAWSYKASSAYHRQAVSGGLVIGR